MTLKLEWAKKPNGGWYELQSHDFSGLNEVGVYHIWCFGSDRNFNVRSGQGVIGARLTAHKADKAITKHSASGTLFVTWAKVSRQNLDRVERFLADYYQPVEGDRYPDVLPLAVTLPGQ